MTDTVWFITGSARGMGIDLAKAALAAPKEFAMKTAHLGDLEVSRLGLGAMTMAGTYTSEGALDDEESIRTIHRALDLGVTHIDTAEKYGPFRSEELVGKAVAGRRDDVIIATKFGLVSHRDERGIGVIDSGPVSIKAAVEGSLQRLGTDHIDLYYQHRVDRNTPIEETAGAVAELIAEGKVLHFGLSEAGPTPSGAPTPFNRSPPCRPSTRCGPATSRRRSCRCYVNSASASFPTHHWATAYSPGRSEPATTSPMTTGARRTHGSPARTSGATCASSRRSEPSARRSAPPPHRPRWPGSWTRGNDIAPIPGTRRVTRFGENTAADAVILSQDQLQRLEALEPAAGERHDETNMASIER